MGNGRLLACLCLVAWPAAHAAGDALPHADAPAQAREEARDEATRPDGARPATELDRILVTARRHREPLREVPASITAVGGDELEAMGATDIDALDLVTPGLVIHPARAFNGSATAYIRGIGQSDPIWGAEPGVAIYIDDVHVARPQGALLDVLDVERVEVLRGPQGTLYGRNTMGGAIRVVTRAPEPGFGGRLTLTAGDHGRRDGRLALNLPVSDTLGTRLAVASYDHDGYGHNLHTGARTAGRDAQVARWSALWAPSPGLEVRLALDRYRDRSGPRPGHRLGMVAPDVDPAQVPLDPGRYDVRSGDREKLDLDSAGASLVVDWAWREGRRLRSITAWRGGDSQAVLDMDSLPPVLFNLQRDFREKQRSQEFQLHAQGETTRAVAGLYLFDGTEAGHGRSTWATPLFQSAQGSIRTRSAAVYGNLVRDLGPDWQLEAGVRHTIETKTATAFNAVWNDPGFSDPRLVNADFTDSARYGATTPRLALARRFGGGTLLYAQASRGFKGGTYNVRTDAVRYPQSVHPVDAETVDAFEVGMKGGWGDGRVEWSAALFHNDYRDIQLGVPVLSESGIFPDFRNAGSGTTRGAELEWRARLAPWLRWNGHLGFLDARYDEYIEGGENVAGQRHVPNSPRRTAGTSLVGEWPLRDGAALVARIDGRYQSRTWPNPELDPRLEQGGYALWNAALAWMSPRRRWDLTLRVDNLADTAYRTSAFSYGAGTLRGAVIGYYGPPRTLSATLGYRF